MYLYLNFKQNIFDGMSNTFICIIFSATPTDPSRPAHVHVLWSYVPVVIEQEKAHAYTHQRKAVPVHDLWPNVPVFVEHEEAHAYTQGKSRTSAQFVTESSRRAPT